MIFFFKFILKWNKYWSSDWGVLFDVFYAIICKIASRKAVIIESNKDFFFFSSFLFFFMCVNNNDIQMGYTIAWYCDWIAKIAYFHVINRSSVVCVCLMNLIEKIVWIANDFIGFNRLFALSSKCQRNGQRMWMTTNKAIETWFRVHFGTNIELRSYYIEEWKKNSELVVNKQTV